MFVLKEELNLTNKRSCLSSTSECASSSVSTLVLTFVPFSLITSVDNNDTIRTIIFGLFDLFCPRISCP